MPGARPMVRFGKEIFPTNKLFRSPARLFLLLCLLVVCLCGCGDSSKRSFDKATNHFIAAQEAMNEGNQAEALKHLDACINQKPTTWALKTRAQLHLDMGNEDQARLDVDKGLELDPGDPDLRWLSGELAKPAKKRFKGFYATSPSSNS